MGIDKSSVLIAETFEEYDISSRGRLRKRRVPNSDDSPTKKKKTEALPSIVTTINGVTKQIYVQGAPVPEGFGASQTSSSSAVANSTSKQASHPVIQQLLSAHKSPTGKEYFT